MGIRTTALTGIWTTVFWVKQQFCSCFHGHTKPDICVRIFNLWSWSWLETADLWAMPVDFVAWKKKKWITGAVTRFGLDQWSWRATSGRRGAIPDEINISFFIFARLTPIITLYTFLFWKIFWCFVSLGILDFCMLAFISCRWLIQ